MQQQDLALGSVKVSRLANREQHEAESSWRQGVRPVSCGVALSEGIALIPLDSCGEAAREECYRREIVPGLGAPSGALSCLCNDEDARSEWYWNKALYIILLINLNRIYGPISTLESDGICSHIGLTRARQIRATPTTPHCTRPITTESRIEHNLIVCKERVTIAS
jgi:hypothetical protein